MDRIGKIVSHLSATRILIIVIMILRFDIVCNLARVVRSDAVESGTSIGSEADFSLVT